MLEDIETVRAGVVSYYNHMTWNYNTYSRGTHGWHHGIWDPGIERPADALLNSNRYLVHGANLSPDSHVLDVGCGVGGLAVWLVREFGCRVTAVTNVERHVEEAQRLAARSGVAERCRFQLMDMNQLDLAAESFDLITNQETVCYAYEKDDYFRSLHRLLKPGGRWHAIDGAVLEGLDAKGQQIHRRVCELWYMAPFPTPREMAAQLRNAGFGEIESSELTDRVLPSARHIGMVCRIARGFLALRLDRLLWRDEKYRADFQRHMTVGAIWSRALLDGTIRIYGYRARRMS
jgi:SAM-dependent methyltransferase